MEACTSQIQVLKDLLQGYPDSTGLKVNFSMSMLVPINLEESKIILLAQFYGCVVGSLPFTYLGLPLGLTKPKVIDFLPLVTRCERRLACTSAFFFYLRQAGWRWQTPFSPLFQCFLKAHKTIIKQVDIYRESIASGEELILTQKIHLKLHGK